ncbi:MAG TPA: cyclodeaminase/cyclohydrolase family protein [Burkholderiales bacterium]|nr:cyclodeaminase/cyclohydrolase family protein [Burkholderiales bacterium]
MRTRGVTLQHGRCTRAQTPCDAATRGRRVTAPACPPRRIAVRAQFFKDQFLAAVEADTAAFDQLPDPMRIPKTTREEQSGRDAAITEATIAAAEVPLDILESCPEVIELNLEIARIGLQASLSAAGVQMGRAAAGAYQNVCINLAGLNDPARRAALIQRADTAWERARKLHAEAEAAILVKLRESVPT